ncbi:pyocin activator PrtN family protein [Rouxiella badensis]|uniref:Pyocin activator PrtN family protein n=1 Tax=Rouxiella silvae TaxID=1646373 RepID=A0AA40X3M5_9GAMM|nr:MULTISPECIES: pyocin activator PrtN family protein [Rouxiella]KAB7896409.1 pyocin activator protein PrtN [Rouxiella sp. S1S-2]MBF6637869.1 pyocin activator PrtN family protein [Rouxiella silvae]MCC3705190.1 pyocin activator PrtN family protein [Rouxiella badensis]MCC3735489.1 pyocin activator PrtN family protein [Rouxiella badensis]MCC3760786.1 pyocin activator PrtN family protein [Rouxiella badensis]
MNTVFLLMAEFETSTVPVSSVCEKYFGMNPATAERKAALYQLPIPTFRVGDSQKAPRMIHITDLAEFIDKQRKEGRALHASVNKY